MRHNFSLYPTCKWKWISPHCLIAFILDSFACYLCWKIKWPSMFSTVYFDECHGIASAIEQQMLCIRKQVSLKNIVCAQFHYMLKELKYSSKCLSLIARPWGCKRQGTNTNKNYTSVIAAQLLPHYKTDQGKTWKR